MVGIKIFDFLFIIKVFGNEENKWENVVFVARLICFFVFLEMLIDKCLSLGRFFGVALILARTWRFTQF